MNPGVAHVEPLGFDAKAYREAHYHQVSDQISPEWNLSGLERDMRLLYETALSVANNKDMPRWAPGNEFEGEWRALHGK